MISTLTLEYALACEIFSKWLKVEGIPDRNISLGNLKTTVLYSDQVPVRHLVFMVHGIGQRLEKSNLVDDVGNFRHITENLAEQHLTSHQRGTQRVLYIPCQVGMSLFIWPP